MPCGVDLGAVGQAVAVGVGVVGVGAAPSPPRPSVEAVAVGVGRRGRSSARVERVGAGGDLGAVVDAAVVGVGVERVGAVGVDLGAVGQAVVVGVGVVGVGAGGRLLGVGQAVAVGVVGRRGRRSPSSGSVPLATSAPSVMPPSSVSASSGSVP